MKQILDNPITVNLEVRLIQDLIQIIGQAVHKSFAHNDIEAVKQHLISKAQTAIQQNQQSIPESSQENT